MPPPGSCGGAYAIRPYILPAGEVVSNKFSGRKDRNEDTGTNLLPPPRSCGGAYAIRPYILPAGDVVSNKFSGRKDRNKDAETKKSSVRQ